MSFDIDAVKRDMTRAIKSAVEDDVGDIGEYADIIVENQQQSLQELGEALVAGDISEDEFNSELEREKRVVEAELMTVQLMTRAAAQDAVNAAIDEFVEAVEAAL